MIADHKSCIWTQDQCNPEMHFRDAYRPLALLMYSGTEHGRSLRGQGHLIPSFSIEKVNIFSLSRLLYIEILIKIMRSNLFSQMYVYFVDPDTHIYKTVKNKTGLSFLLYCDLVKLTFFRGDYDSIHVYGFKFSCLSPRA